MRFGVVLMLTCATALVAGAQQRPSPRSDTLPDSARRAALEGEIRRGFARAVRNRVGLSDEQMARLGPVSQRYEQRRRRIQMEERNARVSLRSQLRPGSNPDPQRVDALLATLVAVEKQRAQLLEDEQRELATIMTPLQRARYMALQEQIRRRLEQMRQRRAGMMDGGVPPGPPPGRPPR